MDIRLDLARTGLARRGEGGKKRRQRKDQEGAKELRGSWISRAIRRNEYLGAGKTL